MFFGFTLGLDAHAQGFDWQYSARLPSEYPKFFVGLTVSGGVLTQSGSIVSKEARPAAVGSQDPCFTCALFEEGDGSSFAIGVKSEYWITGLFSVSAAVRYDYFNGELTDQSDPLPMPNAGRIDMVTLDYILASEQSYIMLDLGARHRIPGNRFFVGVGVQSGYRFTGDESQIAKVASPLNFSFGDNIGQEITHEGEISDVRDFFLAGKVSAGLDLPMALGLYASPSIFFSFPFTSVAEEGEWTRNNYGLELAIMYAW